MKSVILIAGTTGWYKDSYRLAKKAIKETGTRITSNIEKVKALIKRRIIKKVIVINGSRGFNAFDTYHTLKNTKPKVKIVVLDSWSWALSKPDKMILLPTNSLIKTIQNEL